MQIQVSHVDVECWMNAKVIRIYDAAFIECRWCNQHVVLHMLLLLLSSITNGCCWALDSGERLFFCSHNITYACKYVAVIFTFFSGSSRCSFTIRRLYCIYWTLHLIRFYFPHFQYWLVYLIFDQPCNIAVATSSLYQQFQTVFDIHVWQYSIKSREKNTNEMNTDDAKRYNFIFILVPMAIVSKLNFYFSFPFNLKVRIDVWSEFWMFIRSTWMFDNQSVALTVALTSGPELEARSSDKNYLLLLWVVVVVVVKVPFVSSFVDYWSLKLLERNRKR